MTSRSSIHRAAAKSAALATFVLTALALVACNDAAAPRPAGATVRIASLSNSVFEGDVVRLTAVVLDDAGVNRLARADSTETFAYTRERYDDSPDWFVGPGDLRSARQVSTTNPFQKDYAWGRAELVSYRTVAGRDLQGVLIYPANYDASKKYPMIVNPYEMLSQSLHLFYVPTERSYYDATVWSQNGYFVLKPDIVFRGRDPGISVLEALQAAVRSVTSRGIVDSTKVGLVGHSWGGYEATFVPTRTNIRCSQDCRRSASTTRPTATSTSIRTMPCAAPALPLESDRSTRSTASPPGRPTRPTSPTTPAWTKRSSNPVSLTEPLPSSSRSRPNRA